MASVISKLLKGQSLGLNSSKISCVAEAGKYLETKEFFHNKTLKSIEYFNEFIELTGLLLYGNPHH